MFLEDKMATLELAAPYGTQELGFSSAKFEISGGELEVKEKDFGAKKGVIEFKINKASYKNPSTITIKDVKVGTTRSVPFGAYDLKLGGAAVINNYKEKVEDDKSFDITSKNENLVNQDNVRTYDFKGYLDVITETGTFDQVVKVSVGEKTILLGDQAIDMDVAPYIVRTYDFKGYLDVITETGTFDQVVKVSVGEKTILLGDQAIDMDVAPYIQASSNSTMVPMLSLKQVLLIK